METLNSTEIKFRPVNYNLLVKGHKEDTTKGGLYIPETAKKYTNIVDVIAVSDGVLPDGTIRNVNYAKGEKLMILTERLIPVTINEQEYLIIFESDVIGKL